MVAVRREAFLLEGELVLQQPDSDIGSGDAVLCCLLRSVSIFLRVGYPILESVNPIDAGLPILVPRLRCGSSSESFATFLPVAAPTCPSGNVRSSFHRRMARQPAAPVRPKMAQNIA
jgi:hypothetical protein